MQCTILKSFPFSRDGVHPIEAVEGQTVDIPDDLVPGLEAERYLARGASAEAKAVAVAPENKMLPGADENKAEAGKTVDLSALRAEYKQVVGKRAFNGWDAETLTAKIAEHGNA